MNLRWTIPGLVPLIALAAQAAPQAVTGPMLAEALAALQQDDPTGPGFAQDSITALAGLFQMPAPTQPVIRHAAAPSVPGGSVSVASGDLQIALTQLSIAEGTNDLMRVRLAQGDQRDAILLVSGRLSLRDLARQAMDTGIDGITLQDGVVHLSRPLVIWQGAELALEAGDDLLISADSGAFLLSFGALTIQDATLRGNLAAGADEAAFRPFVLVSGAGTLRAEGSRFTGLGMAGLGPFSGVVVSSRGLFQSDQPVLLARNRFDDIGSLALIGLKDAVLVDNVLQDARGTALILSRTEGGLVSGNVVDGTLGSAGVKVTEAASSLQITGNLVTGGAANGVQIDGISRAITLTGNAIFDNAGSGVAVKAADCLTLTGNLILRNGASGLRLTDTGATRITGNALVANGSSALAVSSQRHATGLALDSNLVALNRVGLTGLVLSSVSMRGNDLTGQLPRLFDGAFATHQAAFLTTRDRNGLDAFRIAGPTQGDPADFSTVCSVE
jgi:poly(beta-D-mannuronate) C5 epimerase